ncbi:Putative peptidoglycan-binding domain-containing protein [Rhodovulum sp. P5]|uniref:peptidoglycan-binding domain-containing protein n=1 Tax=Rhodovulum sp. P5 TaxID=1564506 RepID=UPI0009C3003E|nr:hypothetical protein [Rhodovulum sp. P5]ARE39338.1 Putative peptidoglycan-binding domain-containing protein [Rhodovulum sp. P5]
MQRRAFLAFPLALAAGPALAAPLVAPDWLRIGFNAFDKPRRRKMQDELRIADLYAASVDGRYGPGTEAALVDGAALLARNSGGALRIDLTHPDSVSTYLNALARGHLAPYLYGEGDECDGC